MFLKKMLVVAIAAGMMIAAPLVASATPKPKPSTITTTVTGTYGAGVDVVNVGKAKGDKTKSTSTSEKMVAGGALVAVDTNGNVMGVAAAASAGMTTGSSTAKSAGPCISTTKTSESGYVMGGATAEVSVTNVATGGNGDDDK